MAYIQNKKIHFDFEVVETYEAGVQLLGHEVKSVRKGMGSLDGSRVMVRGGEAFLVGATISPYQPGNTSASYEPGRSRKLLLSHKELEALANAESQKGLTLLPVKWYNVKRRLKLEIAVARRKKKYDKRAALKRKDSEKDIARTLKNQ